MKAQTNAGAKCNCDRCGRECQVSPTRNADAQMLRKSAKPSGHCIECAVTEWFVNTYPVNQIIEESKYGPSMLLLPHVQKQFANIMRAALADARIEEINWQRVVDNWSLPLDVQVSAANPHLPGDSMRRRLAQKDGLLM